MSSGDSFGRSIVERQLVELAGEGERHLVVRVVHRCAGVGADVEALVPLQDQRASCAPSSGVATSLPSTFSTPVPPLADAAHVVEGERADAEAVVLEVELERVLARRQRVRAFPLDALADRPGSRGTPACP